MDEGSDYVQRFLEEWELQNRLFNVLAPYRVYMTGFQIIDEER